jgi:DNA-binding transcriptional MocR family regulator
VQTLADAERDRGRQETDEGELRRPHLRQEGRTGTAQSLARAEQAYAERRGALVSALRTRGIDAAGDSGLGVWLPLPEEAAAVRELLVHGWAVSPGERYRFRSAPSIRITTADLEPAEAEALADAIASLRRAPATTYSG